MTLITLFVLKKNVKNNSNFTFFERNFFFEGKYKMFLEYLGFFWGGHLIFKIN